MNILRPALFTSIFLVFQSVSFADFNKALITIFLKTNFGHLTLTSDAQTCNNKSVNVNELTCAVTDLRKIKSSAPAAAAVVQKRAFLDTDQFPHAYIKEIKIDDDSSVSGVVELKGIEKNISGILEGNTIRFNIRLTDFDVDNSYSIFKIKDKTDIVVSFVD